MIKNAKLQNMICLSSRISVYVPSTMHDKEIDNSEFVDRMLTLFSECFGGATSSAAIGVWKSPVVGLIKEKVTIVYSNCTDSDLQAHIETILSAIETLKSDMAQEAISLEINGELYFV